MTAKPYLSFFRFFFGLLLALFVSSAYAQKAQKLDSLFTTLYNKGGFNGCVLVAEDGKPIYDKAFGYADFTAKRPLNNNTVFELASVSKQFTAMAIMQLHQAGKLRYDDSVSKYLPGFPYHGITINNLLHHTSGLPDFLHWDSKMIDVNRINYNADILAALVKHKPVLKNQPGDALNYSNTNYVLLALIVEKLSGISFASYMDLHIFKPLGMANTSVYTPRAAKNKIKDYALGYVFDPSRGYFVISDNIPSLRYQYYFDGIAGPYGISSNTADMLKWDQALYTEQLVTMQEQALAYIPAKLNNGKNAQFEGLNYGFGWLLIADNVYMHSGGYPGYNTIIYRFPEAKKTVILLTNTDNMANIYLVSNAALLALFNQAIKVPDVPINKKSAVLSASQLKAVEGIYNTNLATKIFITSRHGQVYAQVSSNPNIEIYPMSDTEFVYTQTSGRIQFKKDEQGKIKSLKITEGGTELNGEKSK